MDNKQLLGIFLIVVVGLALTPAIAAEVTRAQYGHIWSEETIAVVPATSNVTTLAHGPAWNDTTYITVVLNDTEIESTGAINYTMTYVGTYSVGANLTFAGLTAGSTYDGYCTYRTKIAAMQIVLLGLAPLFWVVLLIGVAVVAIYKQFKPKAHGI